MKKSRWSESFRRFRSSEKPTKLSYEFLEYRKLLAADFLASTFQYSDSTGHIRTLAEEVPMQERFDVLRDVVNVQREDSFRRTSLKRDHLGYAHLKHQQFHQQVPIEGATYTVHIKDKNVVSVSGAFIDYDSVDSDQSLGEDDALESALDFVDADLYMWESLQHEHDPGCNCCACMAHGGGHQHVHHHASDHDLYSDQPPEGELIYLPGQDGDLTLTWMFDVYAVAPLSRQHIFVDAGTGEILETHNQIHHADVAADGTSLYDGTVEFLADDTGSNVRLRQQTNGVQTYDLNNGTSYGAATDITSATTSFTASNVQTGVQAHWGAEQTLQYFLQAHGRDSYDDNGTVLRSYVSYGTDYVNAFWDGSRMTYGDGNGTSYGPLVSLDIVGHEVAHGVTGNSAGLIYQNESGALNESFSDIFGEAIENFATGSNDWLMGDDIGIGGSGALRNMANPNQYGDPDTYFGTQWYTGTGDNGGVHINSGVQNKWFYVLTVGESGTNDNGDAYNVTGIGMQDAGAIAYRNLSVYLNQNSNYAEAREGALQSAADLFGVNSTQYESTAAAWDAVGVYAPAPPEFSFVSAKSFGSGIYRSNLSGSVEANIAQTIAIDLDSDQTLSVKVAGSNGLVPGVEIRDPSGVSLGINSASTAMLENIAIEDSGTYEVLIFGDAGSEGDYEAVALLNSGFEAESKAGLANDTLGTAENIEATSVSFGSDSAVERLAITSWLEGQTPIALESFESGSLGSNWATSSSGAAGRIRVSNNFGAADGDYVLIMDVTQNNTFTLNEAVMTVDLDPATNPILSFSHAEWGDETHPLPDTFTGSSNGDGVAISPDGTNWYTILTGTNNATNGQWTEANFDLLAVANDAGITLGNNFQIKFQQYDNWPLNDDGRAWDNISISAQQSAEDWYEFDVLPGQTVSLTASPVSGAGAVDLSLFDSSGKLVLDGATSSNFNSVISNFTDVSGGTYYARVDGDIGMEYSLVVTRGAGIDVEPNDLANPLPIDDLIGVFGFVSSVSNGTADPDSASNGEWISGFFNGVTLSNPITSNGIYAPAASFATTGSRVFGPSPSAASGFREFENEFQADFHNLQTSVSIDVGSDDASDVGFLRAFDQQGNLLQEVVSGALSTGASETLTITRSTPEIAYIVAAGVGTDITPFDNLVFSSGTADSDYFSVDLQADEILSVDAFLPGAGPNLFDNGLDQATSQLRVQLFDPNSSLVAESSTQFEHIAGLSGTYTVVVSAISNEGEYLLRHNVKRLAEVTNVQFGNGITNNQSNVTQLTLNFNNIVDLQDGALELVRRDSGKSVDLDWTTDNSSGLSLVTVTFSGSLVDANGSLVDGNYQLNVVGSLLGDSVVGRDFVFGDQQSDNFYRFFGDVDGNRTVNVFDLLGFRQTYLLSNGNQGFDARFDSNGDGIINVLDLLKFRQNYNQSLAWT